MNSVKITFRLSDDTLLFEEKSNFCTPRVKYYKKLRAIIPESDPVWPLGLTDFYAANAVFGLKHGNDIYLGVWRFSGNKTIAIPLKEYGEILSTKLEFPASFPCKINTSDDTLQITVPEENSARLIKISLIPGS